MGSMTVLLMHEEKAKKTKYFGNEPNFGLISKPNDFSSNYNKKIIQRTTFDPSVWKQVDRTKVVDNLDSFFELECNLFPFLSSLSISQVIHQYTSALCSIIFSKLDTSSSLLIFIILREIIQNVLFGY